MTPAVEAVRQAGVAFRVHEYVHDPAAESYGLEAAEAMAVEPERVFKTLVASLEPGGRLVVGIVPVVNTLDMKALAAAAGAKRAVMAETAAAERATGYVVGGISPLGQKRRLPTVIDDSARRHETIFVSAGRRGLEIELAPSDLSSLVGADFAPISR